MHDETKWLKKFRFLILFLIFSGSLNIFFAFYFIHSLAKKSEIDLEITPLKTSVKEKEISNCDYLSFISKCSFKELLLLLSNKQQVEEGFCKRDLALGLLVSSFDFNIEKALPNQSFQIRKAFFENKLGDNQTEKKEATLFAGLQDHHFESIIHYALTEKWPLTSKGLHTLLRKWEKPRDATLEKAFMVTEEFYLISNFFSQNDAMIKQEDLLDLLCQLSWSFICDAVESQKKNPDFSKERREQFLIGGIEQNSSKAAELLLKLDFIFVIKRLSDNQIFKILSLIQGKEKDFEQFCVELLKSARSDLIWRKAAAMLYQYANETVPEKFDRKEVMKKFVFSDDLKTQWQKEEIKESSLSSIVHAKDDKKNVHIVKEGENLWKIARRYKVDIDLLMKANKMEKDMIYPGKQIVIPQH